MTLQETKLKALQGLSERKSNVTVSFGNIADENYGLFKFGQITLSQFIEKISEDSPYQLVETFENNFIIIDKKTKILPQAFLDPNKAKDILSIGNKERLISCFPELKDFIEKIYKEIDDASCQSCVKGSRSHMLLQEITFLDNSNRDMSSIKDCFGEKFVSVLKAFPKQNRPTNPPPARPSRPPQPLAGKPVVDRDGQNIAYENKMAPTNTMEPVKQIPGDSSINEGGPRPSCLECCMKHVGTAIVLMEEACNGYPSHRWIAIGELNEAANEVARDFPDVAQTIREFRHSLTKDITKSPNLMILLNDLDKRFFR